MVAPLFLLSFALSAVAISTGTVYTVGAVAILSGIVLTVVLLKKFEEARTEGHKTGYANASKEYEQKLRKQAESFREQFEFFENNKERIKHSEDERIKIVIELFKLCGEYEGCLEKLSEDLTIGKDDLEKMKEVLAWLKKTCDTVHKSKS